MPSLLVPFLCGFYRIFWQRERKPGNISQDACQCHSPGSFGYLASITSSYWNYICRNWRRNKEEDKLVVEGLQTPVESQQSLHDTRAGPQAQKGPSLGLILCWCHLEIINNCWMEGPHFYICTGPGRWCSWSCNQGKPASCRIMPWFMSSPSLVTWCYLSKIRDMQNHRILDLEGTLKHCVPCSWGGWSPKRESVFVLFYCFSSLAASLWSKTITLPLLFTEL